MTEFWRQLENQQRAQRRTAWLRKVCSFLSSAILIGFLLWLFLPEFRGFINDLSIWDRQAPAVPSTNGQSAGGNRADEATDHEQTSDDPSPSATTNPEPSISAATPETTGRNQATPSPSTAKTAEQLERELQQARQRYQDGLAAVDVSLLDQHGGDEWLQTKALVEPAVRRTSRQEDINAYDEAVVRLHQLVPTARLRMAQAMIRQSQYGLAIEQLVRLQADFPDHPATRQLIQDVVAWPPEAWIELALAEADAAPADDPGCAEIWLQLASIHELRGDSSAEREAYRRSWEAVERMTDVERAIETAIDLIHCGHTSADAASLRRRISQTCNLCSQVAERLRRAEYYADLAGLAALIDDNPAHDELLQRAIAASSRSGTSLRFLFPHICRCRALSWYAPPEQIFDVCRDVPKYGNRASLEAFPANAMCYGYAAIAAARAGNRQEFVRSMLLAEAQLASVTCSKTVNPFACRVLTQADVVDGNWRRAFISANNLADPGLRFPLLSRVLAESPGHVSAESVLSLLENCGGFRHATAAVAACVHHQITNGREPRDLLAWVAGLESASLRAAAYVGLARAANSANPDVAEQSDDAPDVSVLPPGDFRRLMDLAEQSAHKVQPPLNRAYAWVFIARTWQRMERPMSYRRARGEVYTAIQHEWHTVWSRRPQPRAGLGDYYYANHPHYYFDPNHRDREAEQQSAWAISGCHRFFAEQQVETADAHGAIESCLDAARVSQLFPSNHWHLPVFLRLQAVAVQAENETKIPPLTLELPFHKMEDPYFRCLVAAWSHDLNELRRQTAELHSDGRRRTNRSSVFARCYAEQAILAAKQNEIELYRQARRTAANLIERQGAIPEMVLMFAEADAHAGEFALSEKNLIKDEMTWYGPPDKPRSTLVVKLAEAGRLEDAEKHYSRLSLPYSKARAMAAILKAKARRQTGSIEELAASINRLEDPIDRVGAYCGLASTAWRKNP